MTDPTPIAPAREKKTRDQAWELIPAVGHLHHEDHPDLAQKLQDLLRQLIEAPK